MSLPTESTEKVSGITLKNKKIFNPALLAETVKYHNHLKSSHIECIYQLNLNESFRYLFSKVYFSSREIIKSHSGVGNLLGKQASVDDIMMTNEKS